MKHNILWHRDAWEDSLYWQQHDKKLVRKISELLKEADHTPFSGKGKPEPLKYALDGYWSRRITREHRLVYKVTDQDIVIAQCRYHY